MPCRGIFGISRLRICLLAARLASRDYSSRMRRRRSRALCSSASAAASTCPSPRRLPPPPYVAHVNRRRHPQRPEHVEVPPRALFRPAAPATEGEGPVAAGRHVPQPPILRPRTGCAGGSLLGFWLVWGKVHRRWGSSRRERRWRGESRESGRRITSRGHLKSCGLLTISNHHRPSSFSLAKPIKKAIKFNSSSVDDWTWKVVAFSCKMAILETYGRQGVNWGHHNFILDDRGKWVPSLGFTFQSW